MIQFSCITMEPNLTTAQRDSVFFKGFGFGFVENTSDIIMYNQLIKRIQQYIQLTSPDMALIESLFTEKILEKGRTVFAGRKNL